MIYLLPRENTFAIFYNAELLPTTENEIIEIEKLPSGNGILRRNTNGEFYYESVESKEITPAPTIEDRLETIEQTSAYTQIQVEYLATLAEINNGL